MNRNTAIALAGVAVIVIAGGVYFMNNQGPSTGGGMTAGSSGPARAPADYAIAATPVGIGIEPVGHPLGYGPQRLSFPVHTEETYVNDKDLTLYTRDADQPGKSTCDAECAKTMIPVTPMAGAQPVGHWTIINRDGGAKQWALNDHPVYTYVKDQKLGDIGGQGGAGQGSFSQYGAAAFVVGHAPEGTKVSYFIEHTTPVTDVKIPYGLKIEEVTDANAIALVDAREMTLYAFAGEVDNDKLICGGVNCPEQFVPLVAPQMAHPMADWTIVGRKDGIEQWAYKGQPLYTYDGDKVIGQVKGMDVDKRYQVAALQKYYLPPSITISENLGKGKIMATADGHTLYRRDVFGFIPNAHQYLHGVPYRPAVGTALSVTGCDVECLKTFHPYLAPADAVPSGHWTILVRPDGARQWAYKDYGLYTYDGDKKPGEMTADDIYDLAVSEDPNHVNDVGTPANGPAALYWTYAPL